MRVIASLLLLAASTPLANAQGASCPDLAEMPTGCPDLQPTALPTTFCALDVPCECCLSQGRALMTVSSTLVGDYGYCYPRECFNEMQELSVNQTDDDGVAFLTVLWRAGGPGFYSGEGVVKDCPVGSYCPWNSTSGFYANPIECDSGEFCFEGAIKPYDCPALENCNGLIMRSFSGAAVVLAILVVALLIFIVVTTVRQGRMLKTSQRLAAEHGDDDVLSDFSVFGKDFLGAVQPVEIEFENVGLTLKKAKPGTPPILSGVTGRIPPGSLTALMGPSGCGKTTFMNTILGRTGYGIRAGSVRVNGVEDGLIKRSSVVGFVPQDDIVHPSMTVFQNLYYHAMLRLPADSSKEAKRAHVQNVIKVLGLEKVQDVLVGTPERRGISGGQKKRVNIGLELVAMPSVIFMDEPTSGLDGAATVGLGNCLGLLSKFGLTIVCVIHQPRWAVFNQFSHVLLLGEGGKTVYCGQKRFLVEYFNEIGFLRPELENPADWMIDVCSGLVERKDPTTGEVDSNFQAPDDLYKVWEEQHKSNALQAGFRFAEGGPAPGGKGPLQEATKAGTLKSLYYLGIRSWQELEPASVALGLFPALLAALFAAMTPIFQMLSSDEPEWDWDYFNSNIVKNTGSMIYYLFIVMKHKNDYGDNLLILRREIDSGFSILGIWFGKWIVMLVLSVFRSITFCLFVFMFATPVQDFGSYWAPYLLGTLCWASFAQWFSLLGLSKSAVTVTLLLWVLFEPTTDGSLCYSDPDEPWQPIEGLESFCPKNFASTYDLLNPRIQSVGRYSFSMLYGAEMTAFDAKYLVNLSSTNPVNFTNYWKVMVSEDDLQDPDYAFITTINAVYMTILFVVHNIVLIVLLFLAKASVKASISTENDKYKKAFSQLCFQVTSCCNFFRGGVNGEALGFKAPHAETARVSRHMFRFGGMRGGRAKPSPNDAHDDL